VILLSRFIVVVVYPALLFRRVQEQIVVAKEFFLPAEKSEADKWPARLSLIGIGINSISIGLDLLVRLARNLVKRQVSGRLARFPCGED